MSPEQLRATCLRHTDAVEERPFDPRTSVFRVGPGGKLFALSALDGDPLAVSLKCDPDEAAGLRARYDAVVGGYHLNKRHWITVTLGGDAPDDLVEQLVEDSYELVAPRPGRITRAPRSAQDR